MTRFFKIISITGQEFLVRPNFKAKIFTIKKNGTTYKTLSMTESGFNKCLRYTGNDWANFFSNEFYLLTLK